MFLRRCWCVQRLYNIDVGMYCCLMFAAAQPHSMGWAAGVGCFIPHCRRAQTRQRSRLCVWSTTCCTENTPKKSKKQKKTKKIIPPFSQQHCFSCGDPGIL